MIPMMNWEQNFYECVDQIYSYIRYDGLTPDFDEEKLYSLIQEYLDNRNTYMKHKSEMMSV